MVSQAATRHKNLAPQKSIKTNSIMIRQAVIMSIFRSVLFGTLSVIVTLAAPVRAAELGQVTNLPVPRFVSMKAAEGNVRRGPSLTHRIDWVFKHRDMPLRITAEHGHWRRVEDRDGMGGWIHYSLLSGTRTVLIEQDRLQLLARPDPRAPVAAEFEVGAIARLGACDLEWCYLRADGYKGWAPKTRLWGVGATEIRD